VNEQREKEVSLAHDQTDLLGSIIDFEMASELERFYDRLMEPEEDDEKAEKPLVATATA